MEFWKYFKTSDKGETTEVDLSDTAVNNLTRTTSRIMISHNNIDDDDSEVMSPFHHSRKRPISDLEFKKKTISHAPLHIPLSHSHVHTPTSITLPSHPVEIPKSKPKIVQAGSVCPYCGLDQMPVGRGCRVCNADYKGDAPSSSPTPHPPSDSDSDSNSNSNSNSISNVNANSDSNWAEFRGGHIDYKVSHNEYRANHWGIDERERILSRERVHYDHIYHPKNPGERSHDRERPLFHGHGCGDHIGRSQSRDPSAYQSRTREDRVPYSDRNLEREREVDMDRGTYQDRVKHVDRDCRDPVRDRGREQREQEKVRERGIPTIALRPTHPFSSLDDIDDESSSPYRSRGSTPSGSVNLWDWLVQQDIAKPSVSPAMAVDCFGSACRSSYIRQGEATCILACGHTFHSACLEERGMVESDEELPCPVCQPDDIILSDNDEGGGASTSSMHPSTSTSTSTSSTNALLSMPSTSSMPPSASSGDLTSPHIRKKVRT